MNPAALKADLGSVEKGGTIIVNEDAFTERNLQKAGYAADPLDDGTLDGYQVYRVPMTSITVRAVEELEGSRARRPSAPRTCSRSGSSRGCTGGRPTSRSTGCDKKFGDKPQLYDANVAAFKAGYNFGETTELFATSYEVKPAPAEPGHLPQRLRRAGARAGASSPRPSGAASSCSTRATRSRPASELLHELSRLKNFGVTHRCRPRTRSPPPTSRSAPPSPATSA